MSEERELLQECYFFIDNKVIVSSKRLLDRIDKPLAQPEQKPVAWLLSSKDSSYTELRKTEPEGADMYLYQITPLYTTPKREPLSNEWLEDNIGLIHRDVSFTDLVRGVEKAHGIGVDDE